MKTLHPFFYPILISFGLLHGACNSPIVGEGEIKKESRNIESFNRIVLNTSLHVTVIVSGRNSLEIVGQQNIIDNIITVNKGNTLMIRSKKGFSTRKPVEIVVTCNDLSALELNGSGKITVLNQFQTKKGIFTINGSGDIVAIVNAKELKSNINGSGDLHLSGNAEYHKLQINGSGDLHAENLKTNETRVTINGSGNAAVNATGQLDVKIVGSGDVEYVGNPVLEKNITGSGNIKNRMK